MSVLDPSTWNISNLTDTSTWTFTTWIAAGVLAAMIARKMAR